MSGPARLLRRLRNEARRGCWPLLPCTAAVLGFGLLLQWSVAGATAVPSSHLLRMVLALVAAVFAALWGQRRWRGAAWPFYLACLAGLVAVLLLGREVNAARRWIHLPGGFTLQPSEFLKVALVILLARHFADRPRPQRLRDLARPAALTLLPTGLILIEPDLGTALSVVPLFLILAWLAGTSKRLFAVLLIAPVLLAPLAWPFIQDYQKERVLTWWNQEQLTDRQKSAEGYHLWHAKIAIGTGGLHGHGWGQGPENRLDLLPERHNDFVFPVLAEEGGLVASALFLALYSALGFVALGWSARRRDRFTRLLLAGAGSYFLIHLVLNVGVTTGLWPTTGLPIPLISQGGSSMMAAGLMLGIAWAAARARPPAFSDRDFADG